MFLTAPSLDHLSHILKEVMQPPGWTYSFCPCLPTALDTTLAQVTDKLLVAGSGVERAGAKPKGSDSLEETCATHETVQGQVVRIHSVSKERLHISKIKSSDSVEHLGKGKSQKKNKNQRAKNVGKDVWLR